MFFPSVFRDATGYIELRAILPGNPPHRTSYALNDPDVWDKVENWIQRHENIYHCYFSLCPRLTKTGKEIKDVCGLSTLWADIDAHDKPKEEAWQIVERLNPPPSVIVDSGGGYHAYWLLDGFYPTPDETARDDAGAIERGLVKHMGGDMAATDLARIFRIPGTLNIKPESMSMSKIIKFEPDLRYPISVFSGMKETVNATNQNKLITKNEIYQAPLAVLKKALRECEFFQYCQDNAEHIPEPLWYGMITSLVRFEGGEETIHQISCEDSRYRPRETRKKILHAISAGYPHTCQYLTDCGWGFECSKIGYCKALTPGRYR